VLYHCAWTLVWLTWYTFLSFSPNSYGNWLDLNPWSQNQMLSARTVGCLFLLIPVSYVWIEPLISQIMASGLPLCYHSCPPQMPHFLPCFLWIQTPDFMTRCHVLYHWASDVGCIPWCIFLSFSPGLMGPWSHWQMLSALTLWLLAV